MDEAEIKYAITVPKVVVEAGVVPPNTAYLVDRVFYGLREAPRLCRSFRDKRVHRARLLVDGRECMFLQMETDPAVWRLVPCDDHKNTFLHSPKSAFLSLRARRHFACARVYILREHEKPARASDNCRPVSVHPILL